MSIKRQTVHSIRDLPPRPEEKIRLEWAVDLSRGPYGVVNWDKVRRIIACPLFDVLMEGIAALGQHDGLRGKYYQLKAKNEREAA